MCLSKAQHGRMCTWGLRDEESSRSKVRGVLGACCSVAALFQCKHECILQAVRILEAVTVDGRFHCRAPLAGACSQIAVGCSERPSPLCHQQRMFRITNAQLSRIGSTTRALCTNLQQKVHQELVGPLFQHALPDQLWQTPGNPVTLLATAKAMEKYQCCFLFVDEALPLAADPFLFPVSPTTWLQQ